MVAILKKGKDGSVVLTQNLIIEKKTVNSYNADIMKDYKIIDTVGAGDCFTSAFCVKYLEICKSKLSIEEIYS